MTYSTAYIQYGYRGGWASWLHKLQTTSEVVDHFYPASISVQTLEKPYCHIARNRSNAATATQCRFLHVSHMSLSESSWPMWCSR